MASKSAPVKAKVIVIGDYNCGKTTLCESYTKALERNPKVTLGVDSFTESEVVDHKAIDLQIHDTAEQERHNALASSYFRKADVVLVCYDITDRSTFSKTTWWVEKARSEKISEEAIFFLVGCKSDLEEKRAVSYDEGREAASSLIGTPEPVKFFETSGKEHKNVAGLFRSVLTSVAMIKEGQLTNSRRSHDESEDTDLVETQTDPLRRSSCSKS